MNTYCGILHTALCNKLESSPWKECSQDLQIGFAFCWCSKLKNIPKAKLLIEHATRIGSIFIVPKYNLVLWRNSSRMHVEVGFAGKIMSRKVIFIIVQKSWCVGRFLNEVKRSKTRMTMIANAMFSISCQLWTNMTLSYLLACTCNVTQQIILVITYYLI